MPDTPSSAALPRSKGPGRLRALRPVGLVVWLGAVALLAAAALVAAAVIPGSHHSVADPAVARRAIAAPTPSGDAAGRVTKVFDSTVSANRFGTQDAQRENGYDANG